MFNPVLAIDQDFPRRSLGDTDTDHQYTMKEGEMKANRGWRRPSKVSGPQEKSETGGLSVCGRCIQM